MALTYTTNETTILGKNGRNFDLRGSLLPPAIRPQGGWYVTLDIKGQTIRIDGTTPRQVYTNARKELDRNAVEISEVNLWLNLNIQWLQRAAKRKQMVTLERLLAITKAGDPEVAPTRDRSLKSPKVWGAKGWAMLQMYLAQDVYAFGSFLNLATELQSWVNPTTNPTLGCAECYRDYTLLLKNLREKPAYSQEEAREWLVSTMNVIRVKRGDAPLSMAKAIELNHWD